MIYIVLALCILLIAITAYGCWLASQIYAQLATQRETIEMLWRQMDGQWKGENYLHARTRALIEGQPPPDKKDYWT